MPESCRVAAVGYGDDHIGINGMLLRKTPAIGHAHFMDIFAENMAVRMGKIYVLKNTLAIALPLFTKHAACEPGSRYGDHLAGKHVAYIGSTDQRQRAGLAGEDKGFAKLAD